MPHPVTIPRLGWSMEEGVFGEWLKAPGELVRAGDMLFVLEGEKAVHEIESFDTGHLCIPADAPRPGTTVKVGDVIGFLVAAGETAPATVRVHPTTSATATASVTAPQAHAPDSAACQTAPFGLAIHAQPQLQPRPVPLVPRPGLARELGIDLNAVFTPDPTGRVLCEDVQRAANARERHTTSIANATRLVATPRARRRAWELGVDWTRLAGSGRNGRIRECDVEGAVGNGQSAVGQDPSRFPTAHSPLPTAHTPLPPPPNPGAMPPASKLRRTIAQRTSAGVHQAVPVTLTTKVDAESLVAYRERLKVESKGGPVPSYNDILIYHAARTSRELPALNACWYRDGIYSYDAVNVATAVDTPNGLLVPVVRDADRLTLTEIADHSRQLVAAARLGKLSQNQLSGGTFTISNLGMFGIDSFTPVLNLPQAAILGVGRIVDEPVVRNGQLVAGKTLTLSLTFDHRVVDGRPRRPLAPALCERLQTPGNG